MRVQVFSTEDFSKEVAVHVHRCAKTCIRDKGSFSIVLPPPLALPPLSASLPAPLSGSTACGAFAGMPGSGEDDATGSAPFRNEGLLAALRHLPRGSDYSKWHVFFALEKVGGAHRGTGDGSGSSGGGGRSSSYAAALDTFVTECSVPLEQVDLDPVQCLTY